MIDKKEIIINSNCDGLPISVALFIPAGEIKGIFQISHGMAEHKERYYNFMEYLTERGYVTVINDHRGHGRSVKDKSDLGYFYENNAEFIIEDLHQISLYVKNLYPDKKLILFGHSMGSMVVRKYIKKYDRDIDKLIVCGSPSKNALASLAIYIVKLLKIFKGEKHRSRFIQKLAFGGYNKKIQSHNSENSWICANNKTVNSYDNDELCGFTFTLNGFENLFKLMRDIYKKHSWGVKNKNMPVLFIAGSDDPVIINEEAWKDSQKFLNQIGYTNVSGKLYNGFRHEILNEVDNKDVYSDIIDFIND